MRIPIPLATAAATALFLTVPARAEITAIRYSYPGDCSAQKARTAGPNDAVTLVYGEPLDLDLLGTGLEGKAQLTGLAAGADKGPLVEAPSGITPTILSASQTRVLVRLLAKGSPPARTTPPIPLKLVRGTTTLGTFQVRVAVRPRIDRIRLGIPGTESLGAAKLIHGTVYPLNLDGVGLAGRSISARPRQAGENFGVGDFLREKDGSFQLVTIGGVHIQIAPATFLWALDSCPLKGPGDAALDVSWDLDTGVGVRVERQAFPRPVSCGTEFRNAIDGSWCATLPPPAPRSEAVVDAPPLRWTVFGSPDNVTGAFTASLKGRGSFATVATRAVRFLRPGESITFETPRPGLRRHVMLDRACTRCLDLGGSPSAWEETVLDWRIEIQPPP